MNRYTVIEKEIGETPLHALERFRSPHALARDVSLSYAGRLDPMAEGKLIVLVGDECKNKSYYTRLDKKYEFEVLLGVSTDTGDILGIPILGKKTEALTNNELKKVAGSFVGQHNFPYPVFSSKTVHGKQLFQYALEDRLDEITIPLTNGRIYSLEYTGARTEQFSTIVTNIHSRIKMLNFQTDSGRLGSDFRAPTIIDHWNKLAAKNQQDMTIITFTAIVSSGTYIRTLSERIASQVCTTGLAYSIKRTVIGKYVPLPFGLGLWRKKYL